MHFLGYKKRERVPGFILVLGNAPQKPRKAPRGANQESPIPMGTLVEVIAPEASRYVCKAGAQGVVTKWCRAGGMYDMPGKDDLYFVLSEGRTLYLHPHQFEISNLVLESS